MKSEKRQTNKSFLPPAKGPQKGGCSHWPLTSFVECVEVAKRSRATEPCPFRLTDTFAIKLEGGE